MKTLEKSIKLANLKNLECVNKFEEIQTNKLYKFEYDDKIGIIDCKKNIKIEVKYDFEMLPQYNSENIIMVSIGEYYNTYDIYDLKTFEKLSTIIEDDINNIFDVDFAEHFSNLDVNEKTENYLKIKKYDYTKYQEVCDEIVNDKILNISSLYVDSMYIDFLPITKTSDSDIVNLLNSYTKDKSIFAISFNHDFYHRLIKMNILNKTYNVDLSNIALAQCFGEYNGVRLYINSCIILNEILVNFYDTKFVNGDLAYMLYPSELDEVDYIINEKMIKQSITTTKNETLIPFEYDNIECCIVDNELYIVKKDDKYKIIDINNNTIVDYVDKKIIFNNIKIDKMKNCNICDKLSNGGGINCRKCHKKIHIDFIETKTLQDLIK